MDISWKKRSWNPKLPKYKGRVVLRGDTVEGWLQNLCSICWTRLICITNDCCKSSGCHRKAIRLWRTSSRCGISLHPSEIGECSKIAQTFRSQNVQTYGYAFQRHKWPRSWSSMEDPVVPHERNLYGHPLAGLLWERQFEEVLLKLGWEKGPNWECLFVHKKKILFLSENVDAMKMGGKRQSMAPMWKKLMKNVDLDEPTWMQTTWNRDWRIHTNVWIAYFCSSNKNNTWVGKTSREKQLPGPMIWKDMPKSVWKDTANWQTRKLSNYTKFQVLALMIINSRKRNLNQWENYLKFAHKL